MQDDVLFPIDENRCFFLHLAFDPVTCALTGGLRSEGASDRRFETNLLHLLKIKIGRETLRFLESLQPQSPEYFYIDPVTVKQPAKVVATIGSQLFMKGVIAEGRMKLEQTRCLVVFETRMIASGVGYGAPYALPVLDKLLTPVTDLHTHSSGQISAKGLIDVAIQKQDDPFMYPTALLDELGIAYDPKAVKKCPRVLFPPLIHLEHPDSPKTEPCVPLRDLSLEQLKRLELALSAPIDRQMTFGELELSVYRMRYPLTKCEALQADMFAKVAEEYARQGIRYAEISTTSILSPHALYELHNILPEIEKNTGVKLRFLAAIPRNFYAKQITDAIHRLQVLAKSPYIVGVDILGYESNKTVHLEPFIRELFVWAKASNPDFIIRIHAGENAKNINNVKEFLYIAQEYGIRTRIGHAIYGMDAETLELAKELARNHLLIIEFNPDSNLALNNIDRAQDIPLVQCLKEGIPAIISSDSAGIYRTDARQLAIAALCTGIRPADMEVIRAAEVQHMAAQERIFEQRMAAFPPDFFKTLALPKPSYNEKAQRKKAEKLVQKNEDLHGCLKERGIIYDDAAIEAAIRGKEPVFIAGASGSNWVKIAPKDRKEIAISMQLLTEMLCPDKAFFITGRTKNEGVGRELNNAIVMQAQQQRKFVFMAMLVEAQNLLNTVTLNSLTHVGLIAGTFLHLPHATTDFIRSHQGVALFVGGGTFTRDFILLAERYAIPFGVMAGPAGASTDKAKVIPKDHCFKGALGMVDYLYKVKPGLFRAGVTPKIAKKRYKELTKSEGLLKGMRFEG